VKAALHLETNILFFGNITKGERFITISVQYKVAFALW